MGATDQLKLLLWKDFLVRRRHAGVAALVFGWAIAVFLILFVVRESVDLEYSPTCQYTARTLPSTGLFPFVQSFICNVDNKCNNLSSYEEIPKYKNARLTGVAKQLEVAFTNDSILNVIKSLPNMIVLLKAVGSGLDSPNLEGIFGPGIKISSLFEHPNTLKREIKQSNPKLDVEVIDEIFDSSLKMGHLFKSFGSSDMGSSICDPNQLERYLILQDPDNIEKVSVQLCNISEDKIPSLIQNIFDHADFTGLLQMIGKTVDHFTNYNPIDDLRSMVETFLGLNFMKETIPSELKLNEWLPEIISLMKTMNKTHLDTDFVIKSLEIIQPHFINTRVWPNYKNLILHITDLVTSIQDKIIVNETLQSRNLKIGAPNNFAEFVTNLQKDIEKLKNPSEKDLFEKDEIMIKIVNDTLNVLPAFYFNSSRSWLNIANILDSITAIVKNKYLNNISTISFIYSKAIIALQNILKHEYGVGSEKIMYRLCEKHSNIVSTLISLGPEFVTSMLHCFGNISCTSIIVANKDNISQLFCDKDKRQAIIPEESLIKNIETLCNFEMKPFIDDLIKEFDLDWINKTVLETETRLKGTKNNTNDGFTSAVINTMNFITRRERGEDITDISWEQLFPDFENTEWSHISQEARIHSGLYIVNVQLCYLKETIQNKPELNKLLNASTILMEGLLTQYNLLPKSLTEIVLLHLPSVVETIIKTFTNKTQIMTLASIDDWEQYFCNTTTGDEDTDTVAKIICEKVTYLNMQSNRPWFGHPLSTAIYKIVDNYEKLTELNWDHFISDAQNIYLTVSEILNLHFPFTKWETLEVFQSEFWLNWIQSLDIDTEIRFGIQLISKIGDFIERNYLDSKTEGRWQQIEAITSTVNQLIVFIFDIIDFAKSSKTNPVKVSNMYPETYNLSKIVVQNFDVLIMDLEKIVVDDNTDLVELSKWLEAPCTKTISDILPNFSAQSLYTLIQIQNAFCNSSKYEEEWKKAGGISTPVNKSSIISQHELQSTVLRFAKILHEMHKINPENITLKFGNLKQIEEKLNLAHKETNFEKTMFKVLDKVLETSVMRQETLRILWKKLTDCQKNQPESCKDIELDTARYSAKFIAAGLQEISTRIAQYLQLINGTEGVDPLRLIGFSNTSAIYTVYLKFPDFIKVFINSYRSADFEDKIFEKASKSQKVNCNDIMNYLIIPENNTVTKEDIASLRRYICPSFFDWPIMQDNLFLSTVTKLQDMYLDIPVSKFNVTFVSVSNSLFDLKTNILDMAKYGKVNVKQLWNQFWTEKMENTFNDIKKMEFNSNNTITRYFKYIDLPNDEFNISSNLVNAKYGFGDFTYFLNHVSNSLEKFSLLNVTSTESTSEEEIEQLKNIISLYSKEVGSLFSYIYFKNPGRHYWLIFSEFCSALNESSIATEILLPSWIENYKSIITDKLCNNIRDEIIKNQLVPLGELHQIKNYNVNLEEIVIKFLATLQNIAKNNSTIHLSSTLTHNFDFDKIFNHTFPTDEELRNSSLERANILSQESRWVIRDIDETLYVTTILVKVLQGGDWWKTLTTLLDEPTINIFLQIVERIPTIMLHLSDVAMSPHLLHDITSTIIKKGPRILCDREFNLRRYLPEDNIISLIRSMCLRDSKRRNIDIFDIHINETNYYYIYKEDKMANHIYEFDKALVDLVKQGPKKFDLPKWMNETEIIKEYKDYAKLNNKPLKLLQTVTVVITEIIDIGAVFYKNQTSSCDWCNWATILVREASQQLLNAQKYTDFLCNAPNMNFTQIRNTLIKDFKWGEFYQDIVSNRTYTVEDFDTEIHDIVDVIKIQLITFYTNKTLQALPEKCLKQIANTPALKNISTYISAVREMTKTLKESSLQFLKTPQFTHMSEGHFSEVIEWYIPILKPFISVLKDNNSLRKDLKNIALSDSAITEILLSKIDVNTLSHINGSRDMEKYLSNRDYFYKLFSFDNFTTAQEIYKEIKSFSKIELAKIFYGSIDENKLNEKISEWRHESMKSLDWVASIFESLEKVVFDGGNILQFISNVDFNGFSTGTFNISNMLKGILDLLRNNSIEKLFINLREFIKGMSPIIRNEQLENDLYILLDGIENLKIFRSLGLLRIKYKISDLVKDWKDVNQYLMKEINLDESAINNLLNASIDLSEIMSSQGESLNMRTMICDPKELANIVNFNSENSEEIAEEISAALCNMTMNDIQNISVASFKHINLSKVMSTIMNSSVNSILSTANMTEEEGRKVVKNIGVGADLLPYLKSMISNISDDMSMLPKFEKLKAEDTGEMVVISPDLLSSASTLLCGRPLVQYSNKLYKVISEAKDFNADKYDVIEQKTLPTDFCRNVYKDVVNMEVGKVIWSYIKPLLRGQILYTPNTPAVRNILENANTTFATIAELQDILFKITDSLTALEDRENIEHTLDNIQNFLNSSIVQMAVQSVMKSTTNSKINLKDLNLKDMLNSFGDSNGITSALKFGSDFLRCVLLNRFIGVDTEEELEEKAKILMGTNEFIAGIVFLNMDNRQKRAADIPSEISYKIRMDIDSIPSTSYLKYKFWTPGPESDFLDELRYFRGFIQLQDLIDNAIIKLKAPENLPKWETLTQEVPYPCWTRDFFKSALAISQTFQVCFFFGLIAVVAAAVRYVVWEKESGNTMVMNVMGLRYLTHCTSWFIVTLFEMLLVIIAIFIILKVGGILPMTNGVLLFLYLLEFGFSVIMFCYMISSMFNSASLAAVGSAIFYLLSFMPYIIIISLETTLEFWSKMITNLSMSTSFCYGCLYMIRYELQGVGLQWNNAWDTPIPGDSMNFGLTCIFLLIDGILYGIIGYLCSRKSQGENYLDDTVSSTNIVNDEPLKIGVTIKGLTKIYNSRKKTVKAIEDIDITLYTGQVTTLLGHNGAGKTTLIKILTGMMQPTSGQIIINSEITENEKDKSRFLGVCPQGSVLISTMSSKEHLLFYAKLKTQKSTDEVMIEVMDMIDSMSLGRLADEPVSHLSEGMRRRLCVAIAFIGKPKLVVLDEPSSGVDPVARRQIWDLVIRYKEGCTVLLTTHYLDEAELLSDRVVVLHKGKVLCSGSPLILRQSYGSGYKITLTYPEEKEQHQTNDTVVDAAVSLVKKTVSNAFLSEIRGFIIDITIPFTSTDGITNNFEAVALSLEEHQLNLGFLNYNMNCATLEQVFLDLCEQADAKENDVAIKSPDTISQLGKSYSNVFSNSIDELPIMKDDEVLINTGEKLSGSNVSKFFALLKKRAIHCTYDWRVIVCALVLPTLFTAVAMGFSLIRPPNSNEPALKLTPELYQEHTTSFISVDTNDMNSFVNKVSREIVGLSPHKNLDLYSKSSRHCVCEGGMQHCSKSSSPVHDSLLKLSSANETVDWIVETQNEYIERRYGGWSLSDQFLNKSAMVVWYNNKGYHSMPSYLNTMNSAILRTISPGSTITTYSHPLKLSVDQLSKSSIAQHIADVGIAMVLLIAFSLVPAAGSIYLVQERVNEEKRMQFLCGVSPTLYWLVAFVWDMIILLCALTLAVIVFKIFGLPVYVDRDNMAAVSLLIFLYGWACIPFIHLAQRLFNDASMANMILFCICTFIGISELTCLLLMDILGKTQFVADFRDVLHSIYLIFPQFVLGDGLVEISKNNIQSEILQRFHMDTYISPLSWELMGVHYLSLALVGIILFIINLIIENEWFKISKRTSTVYPTETTCLEIANLTKIYNNVSGKHAAVNDISLQVPFGQCLGLIGVNGAGKSTTFKMLTTELRPSSGRIFLQGREICRKPLYTGEMGYCPQCDSLDPKLTVVQTLKLYLTLRGIENKNEILNKIMSKFELTSYANRKNENLSGGNKRKLCTALSVLGKTSLILMDEPTSGMDPYSRNLVGVTIQQLIKQNRSVILTSHSVEDCEALCSNVAVMINGRIVCQGSPQNLKERYGSGYIISVRLAKSSEQDLLLELMKKNFPGAEQMSRQYCSSQFAVPTDKTKISEMFSKMTKISEYASVEDFNLVQSSLDQVFINLANKIDATSVNIESKPLPNMYSMDVIQ